VRCGCGAFSNTKSRLNKKDSNRTSLFELHYHVLVLNMFFFESFRGPGPPPVLHSATWKKRNNSATSIPSVQKLKYLERITCYYLLYPSTTTLPFCNVLAVWPPLRLHHPYGQLSSFNRVSANISESRRPPLPFHLLCVAFSQRRNVGNPPHPSAIARCESGERQLRACDAGMPRCTATLPHSEGWRRTESCIKRGWVMLLQY
jgi:hypothetical protein